MTRKVKVGLTLVGSFATVVGGVFGVKALTNPPAEQPKIVAEKLKPEPEAKPKSLLEELPKSEKVELLTKTESGTLAQAPTKSEVKPITLSMDDPPITKPISKPENLPAMGEVTPITLGGPERKDLQFGTPKELPKIIVDSDLQLTQGLAPIKGSEEKKGPSTIPALGEIDPVIPNKPLPKMEEVQPVIKPKGISEFQSQLDEPPTGTNIRINVPKKETEKKFELTPEPITINVPLKKEEPKGFAPLELTPTTKKEEPRLTVGLDPPPAPMVKEKEIPKIEINLDPPPSSNLKEAPKQIEPKPSLLDQELANPTRTPEIKIAPESLNPDPINRVSNSVVSENYDEDLHRPAVNEKYRTDTERFQAISQKFYEEPGYAEALLLYNRERKTGNGSIRIPPVEVLSKLYPNYVPQRKGATPIQPTSATRIDPSPMNATSTYIVSGNGETLREIAQRTFGNPSYWKAIKELNPTVNEEERIPAGTRLLVPAR
jgi:hypothetical protein